MNLVLTWDIGGNYLTGRVANAARILIFGWICFRSNRWWPFVATSAFLLMAMADVVGLLDSAVSARDAVSARIGLGYIVDMTLILSVGERMLAGEPPAGRAAWARANAATAARRNRKNGGVTGPPPAPPRLTSPPSRPTSDA